MNKPQYILSIQSHVGYGHVGNSAATFVLQRLGFDVSAVNTVQFSNHTTYESWSGDTLSAEHIDQVLGGIDQKKAIKSFDAIITGYLGSLQTAKVVHRYIKQAKKANPNLIYCCDPVIGDRDQGCYVNPDLAVFIRDHLSKLADIITPNHFEMTYLLDREINSLRQGITACQDLSKKNGSGIVFMTSFIRTDAKQHAIEILLHTPDGNYLVQTPRFEFPHLLPSGGGDTLTSLFIGQYLRNGRDAKKALALATASIHDIFAITAQNKQVELQLVSAQDFIIKPKQLFDLIEV